MAKNNEGLIIARGISKKDGKKRDQVITRLFYDAETAAQVRDQIDAAIESNEDGVCITLLEGEGSNGPFGMLAANGLEARDDNRGPARGGKKKYKAREEEESDEDQTDDADADEEEEKPQRGSYKPRGNSGGAYKPKTPGYKGRR